METIYLIIVIVLIGLAVSDLVVGVSNDAVNFLNSAIGARVASFRVIMIIAAAGVLIGATFSSGLMEVARKGIFHPEMFAFSEIMIIFLAVMITDVVLLDMFNTFGLPTSTTVSIVFELLGSAVAVSIIKISQNPELPQSLSEYINSAKALAIISGILVSVVIAFSVGALVQYILRLLFTFDFQKKMKYFGALWGGFAITAITYFMIIKGAKGSSFISDDTSAFILNNSLSIVAVSFLGWTFILQILKWLFNIDILKIIVLVGTFALAFAFAGNDLVNFIGVPLAGLESFKAFIASSIMDPDALMMHSLTKSIKTPTLYLLLAGVVMVITLFYSKKARSVVDTTLDLARQDEGVERFGSTYLSRTIVRNTIAMNNILKSVMPSSVKDNIEVRFKRKTRVSEAKDKKGSASFDTVRASVNLVVASILIAFGTSLKLPLSTTYVTFMVAMGTSLADRAWGRESAVYRITGVFSVIGGWFLTAITAFTAAFLFAGLISYGGMISITILIALAVFFVIRTHAIHKKRSDSRNKVHELDKTSDITSKHKMFVKCQQVVTHNMKEASRIYKEILVCLTNEDLKKLRKLKGEIVQLNKDTKLLKNQINYTVNKLREEDVDSSLYYVQVLDYLREIMHCINFTHNPVFEHINNNHKKLLEDQDDEIIRLGELLFKHFETGIQIIQNHSYQEMNKVIESQQNVQHYIESLRKKQIKRIKNELVGVKNSLLFFNILEEAKNVLFYSTNLMKSQRDFSQEVNNTLKPN